VSPDQRAVQRIIEALDAVDLEAVLMGVGGAQMHGAPLVTQDLDFIVRNTDLNRRKIKRLARHLGPDMTVRPISGQPEALRLEGIEPPVDFHFALAGGLDYKTLRSGAVRLSRGTGQVWLASLGNIITAKEAASRPKDLAALVILRYTADTKAAFEHGARPETPPKSAEREARYKRFTPRVARRGRGRVSVRAGR
jgi:hypothetical protein